MYTTICNFQLKYRRTVLPAYSNIQNEEPYEISKKFPHIIWKKQTCTNNKNIKKIDDFQERGTCHQVKLH